MKYLITLLLSLSLYSVFAQEQGCIFNDSLLNNMQGKWKMTGDMSGTPVDYDFTAEWVLNHQFMEWHITDNLHSPPGYMANVFVGWDCDTKRYIVHWIDNMGGKFSETLGYGYKKNNGIEIKFKYPNWPAVNTITYDAKRGMWQFHMTFKDTKKGWVTWSKTTMMKK